MPWIQNDNTATQRLFNDDVLEEPVEFNTTGSAQATEEVAEALVTHYDTIEYKDTDT